VTARAIPQGRPSSVPLSSDSPPIVSIAHGGAGMGGCRVCAMGVHPGERVFIRPYTVGFAHTACGWFLESEKHSVPGACFEATCCIACGAPMYIGHTRPGPWPAPKSPRCFDCRLAAAELRS